MGVWKAIGYVSLGLSVLGAISDHVRGHSGTSPSDDAAAAIAAIAQATDPGSTTADPKAATHPGSPPQPGLADLGN